MQKKTLKHPHKTTFLYFFEIFNNKFELVCRMFEKKRYTFFWKFLVRFLYYLYTIMNYAMKEEC